MEDSEIEAKKIEERKEKIKNWLKDKNNLTFLIILIFAFVVRFYYFWMTKDQPLWYDEAEYTSGGLHWAFDVPFNFSTQRPILFHFLISILMRIGFNEVMIKFILSTLPGILIILVSYMLTKEMYDKRAALIMSIMMSVFWMSTFYSMRIMTDMLGLFLGILTFYFFWIGYVKNEKRYYIWLIGFLIPFAFLMRLISVLFGLCVFLFVIFTDRLKAIKNKDLWIALFIAFLTTVPFLIWYYSYHGSIFGFITSNVGAGKGAAADLPFGWYLLGFVKAYLFTPFLIMFFIGVLTSRLFLGLDLFFKKKEKSLYADFFNLLSLILILAFFVFYFKIAEDRWMIAMTFPLFIFVTNGILFVYDKIKIHLNKSLAILFLLAILIIGAYPQLKFGQELINNKKETYLQVKEAALWIKENSEKDDIIFSNSITQNTYYSERETLPFGTNESEFFEKVKETNPKYIVVSSFENYAPWAYNPSEEFMEIFKPVKPFFLDSAQKQAVLIIYENTKRSKSSTAGNFALN